MTPLSHAEQKQLLYAKSNLPLSLRAVIKHPLFLFLLFASYGPSINIIGQLRFTEIAILIIGSIYIRDIVKAMEYIINAPAVTGQIFCVDGGQHLNWQASDILDVEF